MEAPIATVTGPLESPDVASPPRRARFLGQAATLLLVLALGLGGGWYASAQRSGGGGGGEGGHGGHSHGHGGHDHGGGGEPAASAKLSDQTLKNLGVELGEIRPSTYRRMQDIPAVVVARPAARRPVYSPVAGRVLTVQIEPGQALTSGAVVGEVLRDAFPRPALSLTDAVLRPLNEEYHQSITRLRSATQGLALAREELARVRSAVGGATGPAPIAGKVEVDLAYNVRRAEWELDIARREGERHGMTSAEVARVEKGEAVSDIPDVRRVLERYRLWSPQADAVLALLPEAQRGLPYTSAVLGELVGSNAVGEELVETLRTHPRIAAQFLDIAGLLQAGLTTRALVGLESANAFDPVVELRAPENPNGWDVTDVLSRIGARVEAGTVVAELEDLSQVYLRLSPSGREVRAVQEALASSETLTAAPLVEGTGPDLDDFRLLRLEAVRDGSAHGAALGVAPNEAFCTVNLAGTNTCRSWRLRPGLRYVVRVPADTFADVFVLPAGAVTQRGADSVVLLQDGDTFRPVPVAIAYIDAKVAVVPNDGAVFPGDRVALRGAYALSLAVQAAAGGGVDPHAGHQH